MNTVKDEHSAEQEWRWCLVGNIVETHEFGEEHVIKYGSKHFRPGAKVYINLVYGGMGHEKILVIGVPRHVKNYIEIVISRSLVCNFRVQRVYKPAVLKLMNDSVWDWWGNSDETREMLEECAEWMNEAAEENNLDM